ncbi:MAG: hypothetical protein ACOH2L_13380 [Devosia sp.]
MAKELPMPAHHPHRAIVGALLVLGLVSILPGALPIVTASAPVLLAIKLYYR